jgi:LuxR family maltose regulon positive regulatory protein
MLAEAEAFLRQHDFLLRLPDVAGAQVLALLRQGHLAAAAHLAEAHQLPMSQARMHLAYGDAAAASRVLEPVRERVDAHGWADKRLEVLLLQAVALHARGDRDGAVHVLLDALALAEPGGFVRSFVDEGGPMAELLVAAAALGRMPAYLTRLLAAFGPERHAREDTSAPASVLIEPLSQRELEVLRLIAQGLSNHEIGERLVLALDTVKGHNRKIFGKLQVRRRTEAIARARELGLS